jgi:pyrroline-5-carboxylate reductase
MTAHPERSASAPDAPASTPAASAGVSAAPAASPPLMPLSDRRILFIGGGNMARALIGGLVAAGMPPARIAVIEPVADAREALEGRFGGLVAFTRADDIGDDARFDALVLAVKPQQADKALEAASPLLGRNPRTLLLSIAAGLGVDWLVAASGGHRRVFRAMPNTPCLIGEGISGLFSPADAEAADRDLARAILSGTGEVIAIEQEHLMDIVTAVSGSGPAYAFYLIEAMSEAGVAGGLEPAAARALAVQTVKGAALLAIASEEPPEILRARVTSPGGTTAAAVAVLDRREVKSSIGQAIQAAAVRSRELSDEADKARRSPG